MSATKKELEGTFITAGMQWAEQEKVAWVWEREGAGPNMEIEKQRKRINARLLHLCLCRPKISLCGSNHAQGVDVEEAEDGWG